MTGQPENHTRERDDRCCANIVSLLFGVLDSDFVDCGVQCSMHAISYSSPFYFCEMLSPVVPSIRPSVDAFKCDASGWSIDDLFRCIHSALIYSSLVDLWGCGDAEMASPVLLLLVALQKEECIRRKIQITTYSTFFYFCSFSFSFCLHYKLYCGKNIVGATCRCVAQNSQQRRRRRRQRCGATTI